MVTGARRLVVLGSGTSTGVPVLGCDCRVCLSDDPKNARMRASVLMGFPRGNLLIDTTPEMRLQLLREKVRQVHAIAYTHAHADHLFGLDDARLFPRHIGGPVPIFCEEETEQSIRKRLPLCLPRTGREDPSGGVPSSSSSGSGRAWRSRHWADGLADPPRSRSLLGPGLPGRRPGVLHRREPHPAESWPLLEGLDTLILDALRHEPHPTHFSLERPWP
jgi:phosphoribosyl 1,2-cyclic phosphate phosphodiesterase